MLLPILLSLTLPLIAQDVFSATEKGKSQTQTGQRNQPPENPCANNRSMRDCGYFFYNPTETGSLDAAKNQCHRFCAKYGGIGPACECHAVPDRGGGSSTPVTPARNPKPNVKLGGGTANNSDGGAPRPSGLKMNPVDLGPGLKKEIASGRCQGVSPNPSDLYLNCPGYVPDLVNDRLQKDPTAPDPANPAPIRLYGGVTQTEGEPPDSKGNGRGSRFGVGNINEADPPLLVTAQMLAGIDDCLKENLTSDIAMLPLTFAAQKYRGLKTLMVGFGLVGNPATLVHDINATLAPGQSLGDRSYEIGLLLCDGYQLKDLLNVNKNPLLEPEAVPGLDPVRPKNTGLLPTYRDPLVKGTLERGIPLVDHKALQAMAQDKGLNIVVRDSSPFAMKWVGHPDAVSKPVDVKAKTLKPPSKLDQARMSPAERAREKLKEPYYGLVTAHGMTSGELSLLQLKGYKVDDPTAGYLIRTSAGKMIHSDTDLHGLYDQAGNNVWPKSPAGEQILLKEMDESTLVRMFRHGPQDVYTQRNDPRGPSYGPQPPATIYTHDGRVLFADSIQSLKSAYHDLGIAWEQIYPNH